MAVTTVNKVVVEVVELVVEVEVKQRPSTLPCSLVITLGPLADTGAPTPGGIASGALTLRPLLMIGGVATIKGVEAYWRPITED